MLEKIKDKLNDVIAIADRCPEKYQVKCFEILLGALVTAESGAPVAGAAITAEQMAGKPHFEFFTRYGIGEEQWQRVINFDGETYSIIVGNLNEKSVSKKQVRLALLLGVKGYLETGVSTIEKSQLVELCKQHATYDSANFSTHMKNRKNLFLAKGDNWILTKPGEKQAIEVVKELSQ